MKRFGRNYYPAIPFAFTTSCRGLRCLFKATARRTNWRTTAVLALLVFPCIIPKAAAQDAPEPNAENQQTAVTDIPEGEESSEGKAKGAAASVTEPSDAAAHAYALKCLGCHTIGGGQLSGPDLKPTAAWPTKNLYDAIVRMEKNVGTMSEEEIEGYVELLRAADAGERLAAEQKRLVLQHAAQLEPASASVGEALFTGRESFANGAVSCASCHQAGGRGGNLASSLEDAYSRIGELPLIATCESPGYPVMKEIYAKRPLTKQEAVHVVKYLEKVNAEPKEAFAVPLHGIGIVGAALILALLRLLYPSQAMGVRARLVAESHQKENRGAVRGSSK